MRRDLGSVPCEDDRVSGYDRERCEVGIRVLEGSGRDGNGRCGYGRVPHGCGKCDRDVNGHDESDHDENVHCVNGRLHAGDQYGNDLSGHVRRASAHAHDARGRRRSCQ